MALIKQFNTSNKELTLEFTTLSSLVEYIKETPTNECYSRSRASELTTGRINDSFTGTKTFEEALGYLENGWTAMSEKLTDRLKLQKQLSPVKKSRKVFQSVVGYTPIVPNYLHGIPTDMLMSKIVATKQRVITINKDNSYMAGDNVNDIEKWSIEAFRIVQAIEAQGIRCNLNLIHATSFESCRNVKRLIIKVRIKGSGEKLNISKMSFPMINPAMTRRIFWRVYETMPEFKAEDWTMNTQLYGRLDIDPPEVQRMMEAKKEYYISKYIRNAEHEADRIMTGSQDFTKNKFGH